MSWEEFEQISAWHDRLLTILGDRKNRPLLSRIREIGASWADSRDLLRRLNNGMSMEVIRKNLEAEKWRWRMVYALKRFAEQHATIKNEVEDLQKFILDPVSEMGRAGIELLSVVSRWCELELRQPTNSRGGE
jgi:hypothetical protein